MLNNFHRCQPAVRPSKLCSICPSGWKLLHKFSVTFSSSCGAKAEKALSFVIHHPPAWVYALHKQLSEGFPPWRWGMRLSLCVLAGFYPVNHTDCLQSHLHHCFDGITGELAHAFFPPTGEIHFDDHEYWILGNMRFSWKKGRSLLFVMTKGRKLHYQSK